MREGEGESLQGAARTLDAGASAGAGQSHARVSDALGTMATAELGRPSSSSAQSAPAPVEAFVGDRFELVRQLGRGTAGAVFEVVDHRRQHRVALKVLHRPHSEWLYWFKQEFRELVAASHPNLATLYELISVDDQWGFTMELVDGSGFCHAVRPDRWTAAEEVAAGSEPAIARAAQAEPVRRRLHDAVCGLHHLHRLGRLHRDVKPGNLCVDSAGATVVLDFGLVVPIDRRELHAVRLAGTPNFMSPEQAGLEPLTAASDWYAVGVTLYSSLTGRFPIDCRLDAASRGTRTAHEMSRRLAELKRETALADPREHSAAIPDDLATLCLRLLDPDPDARPSGDELLARLAPQGGESPTMVVVPRESDVSFVGRKRELRTLRAGLDAVAHGRPLLIEVSGGSGMGKSALVSEFCERLARNDSAAITLRARCLQQADSPFQGLDELVDQLALRWDEAVGAELALSPADAGPLCRSFPVLRRVRALATLESRSNPQGLSVHEARRRAFSALRRVLAAVARRRPLVIAVDDVQWADADGAELVRSVFASRDAPAALVVVTCRSDEREGCAFFERLEHDQHFAEHVERRYVELAPLEDNDARDLLRRLVPDERVDTLIRQSGGNPTALAELAWHVGQRGGSLDASEASVDRLIVRRVRGLTDSAQRLVEVAAVAGRPVSVELLGEVSGLGQQFDSVARPLAELGAQRLVRRRERDGDDLIEPYHDRVREALRGQIGPEARRALHARIADILERDSARNSEPLVHHLMEAGRPERAAHFALLAARGAEAVLAFDRAAAMYRIAFEHGAAAPEGPHALARSLANALGLAGRGREAAEAFLVAADLAPEEESAELRREAATQFLHSGEVVRAKRLFRDVLAASGDRLPRARWEALASVVASHVLISIRARKPRALPAQTELDVADDPATLARVDALSRAGKGLSVVDPDAGAALMAKAARLALRTRDSKRIAELLHQHGAALNYIRPGSGDPLLEVAQSHLGEDDDPVLRGRIAILRGVGQSFSGDLAAGQELCDQGERTLVEHSRGVAFDLILARMLSGVGRIVQGRLRELAARLPEQLREANERGDDYGATAVKFVTGYAVYLAHDERAELDRGLREAMRRFPPDEFFLTAQGFSFTRGIGLGYAGELEAAADYYDREIRHRKVQHLRLPLTRTSVLTYRALFTARAAARAVGSEQRQWLERARRASRDLRRCYKGGPGYLNVSRFARLVDAELSAAKGDVETAVAELRELAPSFVADRLNLFADIARYRLGQLLGGTEGAAVLAEVEGRLRGEGVVRPAAYLFAHR